MLEYPAKLPRKEKRRQQRLAAEAAKANPAGSPSPSCPSASPSTPRVAKSPRAERWPKPVAEHHPKKPRVRNPRPMTVVLVELANELAKRDLDAYTKALDEREDPKELTDKLVESSFSTALAKYPEYEAWLLMRLVIANLRANLRARTRSEGGPKELVNNRRSLTEAQRARTSPGGKGKPAKKPKGPIGERQTKKPGTASPTATARTRPKGAPKAVPHYAYSDSEIVEAALDELFQEQPELKALFCGAVDNRGIRELLCTDAHIEQLMVSLKEGLVATPSRVFTYLEIAARNLVAVYKSELEEAAAAARQKAASRREQKRQAAIEASAGQVAQISQKAHRQAGTIPRKTRKVLAELRA